MDSKEVVKKIRDLNPHVVCSLCAGYFVDATTITECLHTCMYKLSLLHRLHRAHIHVRAVSGYFTKEFFHQRPLCQQLSEYLEIKNVNCSILQQCPPNSILLCKSCIVKYFQTSKNCPMCNLQIHETQPLFNLRLDRTMQDIVAKLVPGIVEAEEKRRREFYESRGMAVVKPSQDENENGDQPTENVVKRDYSENRNMYRDDEQVSLCVERYDDSMEENEEDIENNTPTESVGTLSKKYLRCSARMMVVQLQKLLRMKLNIPAEKEVEIVCNEHVIHPFRTMKFIWISEWLNREPPMVLHYRVHSVS